VAEAVRLRRRLFPDAGRTDAYRLVHAEGDGLPGLVVDRWGGVLVAQFATAAVHRRRSLLAEALLAESGARSLLARPGGYEAEEGIPPGEVEGSFGDPAPDALEVREEGMRLSVEPRAGQKTGHYADQRENRVRVAEVAAGGTVLDLYAGTGGFSVQALRHGASSAVAVESSARAADAAVRNAEHNGVRDRLEVSVADVRHALEDLRAARRTFDVVVADPPNFFPRRGPAGPAVKAYRELNVRALTRVGAGGFLATFCCSASLDARAFADLVRSAARECRRAVDVLRELTAGPDHPVAVPEGRYLTGLLLRVR
jgi:23S rRNA (cytosine1962-C5)-methyltransferase